MDGAGVLGRVGQRRNPRCRPGRAGRDGGGVRGRGRRHHRVVAPSGVRSPRPHRPGPRRGRSATGPLTVRRWLLGGAGPGHRGDALAGRRSVHAVGHRFRQRRRRASSSAAARATTTRCSPVTPPTTRSCGASPAAEPWWAARRSRAAHSTGGRATGSACATTARTPGPRQQAVRLFRDVVLPTAFVVTGGGSRWGVDPSFVVACAGLVSSSRDLRHPACSGRTPLPSREPGPTRFRLPRPPPRP